MKNLLIYINLLALTWLPACKDGTPQNTSARLDEPKTAPTLGLRPLKILSLDGGGVRGLVTISLLEGLESALKKPLSEIFDIIVGTSSGGIIALALNSQSTKGGVMRASHIKEYLEAEAQDLFDPRREEIPKIDPITGNPVLLEDGIPDWEYAPRASTPRKALEKLFGAAEFKNLAGHTIVTSVDAESSTGFALASNDPRFDNLKTHEAALATLTRSSMFSPSAFAKGSLKTYFATKLYLKNEEGILKPYYLMGGSFYKNNPSLLAINALENKFGKEELTNRGVLLVSIGAGKPASTDGRSMVGANVFEWMDIIVELISDGSSSEDEETLELLFKSMPQSRILRLEPLLDNKKNPDILSLSNVKQENIAKLLEIAEQEKKSDNFIEIVKILQSFNK